VRLLAALLALAVAHAAPPPVTALAFSPDGKLLAAGGYQQIQLFDTSTNKPLRTVGRFPGQVRALAFRDPHTIAVAEGVAGRSGSVSLLDLETGAGTPVQRSADEMLAVAFSADGKLLASASADRTARVWLTSDWREDFQLPREVTEPVNALAFSLEGDLLAFATGGPEEHAIRTWRTQGAFTELDPTRPEMKRNLSQTRPIDTGACVPLTVVFLKSQPRSRMVVGCTDKTLRLLGNGGNTIASLTGPADWVYAVAGSPDGQKIAAGSGDGAVKFWIPNGGSFKPAPEPKP